MTTSDENLLLTATGPGTPGGDLMRCYWQPIALASEIPSDGAPLPMRLFGEDLVLFRDDKGRLGLLGLFCSHRCADLSYGRVEDGGLRCLYHGWLFDVEGRCLEQPAEPPESRYKDEIRHPAYKVVERAGMLFAYMGKGVPPLLPDYEFLSADPAHLFLQKTYMDCNYLQSLEGDIDPSHLSYLHRPMAPVDKRNVPGAEKSADTFYREDVRPKLEWERSEFGIRIYSIRGAGDKGRYVRDHPFHPAEQGRDHRQRGAGGRGLLDPLARADRRREPFPLRFYLQSRAPRGARALRRRDRARDCRQPLYPQQGQSLSPGSRGL